MSPNSESGGDCHSLSSRTLTKIESTSDSIACNVSDSMQSNSKLFNGLKNLKLREHPQTTLQIMWPSKSSRVLHPGEPQNPLLLELCDSCLKAV